MLKIPAEKIIRQVIAGLNSANKYLSEDVLICLKRAYAQEESERAKKILAQILENATIAVKKDLVLCQDTGQIEFFVTLPRRGFSIENEKGENLSLDAVLNQAVSQAYKNRFRASVVGDPLRRKNTGDNTPAIIHCVSGAGNKLEIKILVRGGGTDNASTVMMLEPTIEVVELQRKIVDFVREKSPYACPPVIVGIGIGGSFSTCGYLAKVAVLDDINEKNRDEFYQKLEETLLNEINRSGIGPMGLGGKITALAVKIKTSPCHIASLPVGITLQCHSLRKYTLEF